MAAIFSMTSGFSSPKVVVVGAGIAGLTAAYRLQQEGFDVELYEARNRVGGRIFTVNNHGHPTELGGQNFGDGGDPIHIKRLIEEFGLECVSSRIYLKHSYFDGENILSMDEILKEKQKDPYILRHQIDALAATSCNMKEILDKMFDPEDPLYKFLAVRLAAYEGGSIEDLSPLYAETLFHILLGGICAAHQANGEESYVDLMTLKGGNGLLPEKIAEALGPHLHLNMPLKKVSKKADDRFELLFQNGKEIQADLLILAIPCSVYEQILFEDGVIPSQKLEAIQNVQYGTNAKIIVPFTSTPQMRGVISDEILAWFDPARQALTLYYTGRTSFFSPETITNAYIQARPMIETSFKEDCPPFKTPLHATDQSFLCYDSPIGHSWPNDPYAKGSYSYIARGQENILMPTVEENGETFKTLFAPIGQLYFAGEHSSILSEVPGTMEAACESGERIARAVLKNCIIPNF